MRSVFIVPKKWSAVLSEIESSLPNIDSIEDYKSLTNQFELIPENIRDEYFPSFYLKTWRVALNAGKLSLANSYAKKSIEHLIEFKRIPQIKILLKAFLDSGLFKNKLDDWLISEEILLGKRKNIRSSDLKHIELFLYHPEHWKQFPEFIQQYLLLESEWNLDLWKLCYEYILIKHFDKDLFLVLLEKSIEMKDKANEKKFTNLLLAKKIKLNPRKLGAPKENAKNTEKLNLDYDQIAMDLLSGAIEPNHEEQRRVISSLKYISKDELLEKGQEMIVAFELLGMEQVVHSLCESMIVILTDVKARASTFYVWAQALMNSENYYKAIDLIDNVLDSEPLYGEELLAFYYLKAEALLKLKKTKMAKELYLIIKEQKPHYRLTEERLKSIESA